jgi:hypothetical protein
MINGRGKGENVKEKRKLKMYCKKEVKWIQFSNSVTHPVSNRSGSCFSL